MKTFKRRSNDDIIRIKKALRKQSLNPKYALLAFISLTILITLTGGFFGTKVNPKPWGFSLNIFLEVILISLIISLVFYISIIIYDDVVDVLQPAIRPYNKEMIKQKIDHITLNLKNTFDH